MDGESLVFWIVFLVLVAILFGIYLIIDYAIKMLKIAIYRKIFPLDQQVKIKIDREKMNNNYYQLTEEETKILEKTDKCQKVYVTRKIKNELVITVDGIEKGWTVFQSSSEGYSDNWIKYFRKGYFTKPEGFVKGIAFKKAMI